MLELRGFIFLFSLFVVVAGGSSYHKLRQRLLDVRSKGLDLGQNENTLNSSLVYDLGENKSRRNANEIPKEEEGQAKRQRNEFPWEHTACEKNGVRMVMTWLLNIQHELVLIRNLKGMIFEREVLDGNIAADLLLFFRQQCYSAVNSVTTRQDAILARAIQCSKFNGTKFNGYIFNWVPYLRGKSLRLCVCLCTEYLRHNFATVPWAF